MGFASEDVVGGVAIVREVLCDEEGCGFESSDCAVNTTRSRKNSDWPSLSKIMVSLCNVFSMLWLE